MPSIHENIEADLPSAIGVIAATTSVIIVIVVLVFKTLMKRWKDRQQQQPQDKIEESPEAPQRSFQNGILILDDVWSNEEIEFHQKIQNGMLILDADVCSNEEFEFHQKNAEMEIIRSQLQRGLYDIKEEEGLGGCPVLHAGNYGYIDCSCHHDDYCIGN